MVKAAHVTNSSVLTASQRFMVDLSFLLHLINSLLLIEHRANDVRCLWPLTVHAVNYAVKRAH